MTIDPEIVIYLQLVLFVFLLGCSAFFSSSETGLFSLNATQLEQLRQDRHPRLELIQRLLAEPRRLIVTILIGNELVNVSASNISAILVIHFLGGEEWWINILVMLPILLLVGEITPKTFAVQNSVAFASFVSRPLDLFSRLITPLRWVVRHVSDFFITMIVGEQRTKGNIVTEDMVRTLTTQAEEEGVMDDAEREMIHNVFDFGEQTVSTVMTPRADMVALSLDTPLPEILAAVRTKGFTRIPMYQGNDREAIAGILHARDLLNAELPENLSIDEVTTLLRKPLIVPESRRVADLFKAFKEKQHSIALVVDEYGDITGLVSMDDLLRVIFGDIVRRPDERDDLKPLADGWLQVDGGMEVEEFNAQMQAKLPMGITQTIAGLLLHTHGELPTPGVELTLDSWRFRVSRMEGHRIVEAMACRLGGNCDTPPEPPPPDSDKDNPVPAAEEK